MAEHRLIRLHHGHLQALGQVDAAALDLRDLWEERAGIVEYMGGMDRAKAEHLAFLDVVPEHLRDGAA